MSEIMENFEKNQSCDYNFGYFRFSWNCLHIFFISGLLDIFNSLVKNNVPFLKKKSVYKRDETFLMI
jgi:hypothetical protein